MILTWPNLGLPAPKVMILFSSFRCDARCVMCYTWVKQKWKPQLSLKQLEKILGDPLIRRSIEIVNLAGGEPTLRNDLVDMVALLVEQCTRLKTIDIPTNGFQTDRVVDQVERILALLANTRVELAVTISIDGIGVVHERIRGREGVFAQVTRTVEELKSLRGLYSRFRLGLNTVISRHNADRVLLRQMLSFARSQDIALNFTPAAESEIGVESVAMKDQYELTLPQRQEVSAFFEELRVEGLVSHPYAEFVINWLKTGHRSGGCAFRDGKVFLVEPDGESYLCGNYKDFRLGNLTREPLSKIWPHQRAFTKRAWDRRCTTCASNCYIGEA